jgi:hypothetical protein
MRVHVNTKYGHSASGELISDNGDVIVLKSNHFTIKVAWSNIDIYQESE